LTLKELSICKEEALRTVVKILELEKIPVFTQNTHYLESEGKKWLSRYSYAQRHSSQYHKPPLRSFTETETASPCDVAYPRVMQPCSPPCPSSPYDKQADLEPQILLRNYNRAMDTPAETSSYERTALNALNNDGKYGTVVIEDLATLPTCEFREELAVMARVRAYFQVAYKVSAGVLLTTV
jgi:vacuolar protein sorting-associated protein 1